MNQRLRTIFVTTLIVVGLDHGSKYAAWSNLRGIPTQRYFGDLLRLSYHENPGAFLSLGATLPPWLRTFIFSGLVSLFLIYLLYFLLTDDGLNKRAVAFGGMMFAGGLGNLIDRIFFDGGVIDFLNVGIGSLRTGIFNVADMAIMAGVIGFFVFGRPTPRIDEEDGVKEDEIEEVNRERIIEHDTAN